MEERVSEGQEISGNNEYVVLARKYRSQTFGALIGQEALVRTLTNAIARQRLHHAYVLTGIRGVGKTSTARLLAMALNCENGPAVTWADDDAQVAMIRQGNHPDVLEFDAASNRGVEDIADLFSGLNYAPVMGRCKVYIIDEVHMLSGHAFNALLKTLEEPPPQVRFIFATTEVQKIPVTVLSRCQRFDLKRISSEVLQTHFAGILGQEKITFENEAVAMVARAADGSVRDGLSLLDQAIVLGADEGGSGSAPHIGAATVQRMLGLADRQKIYDLLEPLLAGEAAAALALLDDLYAHGQDAVLVVQELLEVLHLLTRIKLVPGLREGGALSELEKTRGGQLAGNIELANLGRAYQLLAQVVADVKQADRPYEALSMALVRVAYLAPLPAFNQLAQQASAQVQKATEPVPAQSLNAMVTQPVTAAASAPAPWEVAAATPPVVSAKLDWKALVEKLGEGQRGLAAALREQVRCVELDSESETPLLVVAIGKGLYQPKDLLGQLKEGLKSTTGQVWEVREARNEGMEQGETLNQTKAREGQEQRAAAAEDPLVREVMNFFPGAVVEDVIQN